MQNDFVNEIKAWMNDPDREYSDGLLLLEKISGSQRLASRLQRKSNKTLVLQKIEWELQKFLPKEDIVVKQETPDLPQVILRIKAELPILFNQRAELQKELIELGDGNEEETVEMAARLGEIIAVLATRHQLLHEAKELYFNSNGEIIPNEEELFPEGDPLGGGEKPKVNVLESGDPVEIMKRRDNLISSLTKDRNLLQYQSKSARDKDENPMPQGPERDKIEARIKEKEEEMEAINQYLAELKNSTEQPA
jgi:hypothetical protein